MNDDATTNSTFADRKRARGALKQITPAETHDKAIKVSTDKPSDSEPVPVTKTRPGTRSTGSR
jgi:hypothetical protein